MEERQRKEEIVRISTSEDLMRRYNLQGIVDAAQANAETISALSARLEPIEELGLGKEPLSVVYGGTGAGDALQARENLGIASFSTYRFVSLEQTQAPSQVVQVNWGEIATQNAFIAYTSVNGLDEAFIGMKYDQENGAFMRVGSGNLAGNKGYYQIIAGELVNASLPRLLWQGSWSSGSITAQGLGLFRVFLMQVSGGNSSILFAGRNANDEIIGSNIEHYAEYQYIRYLRAGLSADTATLVQCTELRHNPGTSHSASFTNKGITAIWGVC